MFHNEMTCRMCGIALDGSNIGYVSTSNGSAVCECRTCHAPSRPSEPKPAFKSWRIFRREPNI